MTTQLSVDHVNYLISLDNRVPFPDIFDDDVRSVLAHESIVAGTSLEFVICPLVTSIGFLLGQSTIEPFPNDRRGVCTYSALIAHPSTGKSGALNLVKKALVKIETFYQIPVQASQLTNAGSVEGLLDNLTRIDTLIGLYDEANTFTGSFGRYASGANSGTYERSIYLSLFNAPDSYDRDLKQKRSKLLLPRYHMCLLGHPVVFTQALVNEKSLYDDGLFQRILMSAGAPPQTKARDIRNAPKSRMALHSIFLLISIINKTTRNFTFSNAATVLFDEQFDLYKDFVTNANISDSYLGGLLGKTTTHVTRFCMIIKSLFVVIKSLNGVEGVHEQVITRAFEQRCQAIAKNLQPEDFVIDVTILTAAIKLVEYFNNHKLILSAYECSPDMDFITNLKKIFKANNSRRIPTPRFAGIPVKVLDKMRRVFEIRRSMTNPKLLGNNNLERELVNQCFTQLQSLRLGRLYQIKALNGVVVDHFVRISSTAVKEDLSIAQSIIDLGCDITTVIENLEATESSETQMLDPEIRKRSKRPHNNDDASNGQGSKKIKILDDDNLIKLSSHKGQEFIFNEALIRRLMPSFELDPAPTLNQNEYSAAGNDENPEQSLNVMNDDYTADIDSEQTRQQAIGVFQDLRRSLSSSKVATTTNSDESTFSENEREDDIIASHQQALLITEPNNESQPSYSPITNTTNASTLPSNNLSQSIANDEIDANCAREFVEAPSVQSVISVQSSLMDTTNITESRLIASKSSLTVTPKPTSSSRSQLLPIENSENSKSSDSSTLSAPSDSQNTDSQEKKKRPYVKSGKYKKTKKDTNSVTIAETSSQSSSQVQIDYNAQKKTSTSSNDM